MLFGVVSAEVDQLCTLVILLPVVAIDDWGRG
jgi:hypothetical protein